MSLRIQEVRDLASVFAAPNLLSDDARPGIIGEAECRREIESSLSQLQALDLSPVFFHEWLAAQPRLQLLGRYFEALVTYWLKEFKGVKRLHVGVPVRRLKQVMGELDFIFEDSDGLQTHWEVAVKFYLCTAPTPEEGRNASSFIGTMTRDRLDLKISKVFDHQVQLAAMPEGREKLRELGFEGEMRSRALVKGALFYPVESDWRQHPHPTDVSPHHLRGWWAKALPQEARSRDSRWVVLDKRRWLSQCRMPLGGAGAEPLTFEEMTTRAQEHFSLDRTAFMVAEVGREGENWIELARGILVHEGWPWAVTDQRSKDYCY